MVGKIALKEGLSAAEFRTAAKASTDANQARRLLALAAIRDGRTRTEAALIGGMDRQTLVDWVHAYNERDLDGLLNTKPPGRPAKLTDEQKAELKALVEKGPDPDKDGLVRWRRIDLARIAEKKFGVIVHADTIGRILHELGFSHISARPLHPEQQEDAITTFKKRSLRG
jgi:transposase